MGFSELDMADDGFEQTLMLKPAFALVSMNITLNSRALASPSSIDTCLWQAHPFMSKSYPLRLSRH